MAADVKAGGDLFVGRPGGYLAEDQQFVLGEVRGVAAARRHRWRAGLIHDTPLR